MISIRFRLIIAFAFSRMISSTSKTIVWLRNDLRIHDNVILHEAKLNSRNKNHEVICLYCFDPRHFATTPYGSIKSNTFRTKFLTESVANLRKNLQSIESDLLVTYGKPEIVIPQLLVGCKNGEVLVHSEHAYEENEVEIKVEKALKSIIGSFGGGGIKLRRLANGASLYHPDDLPYNSINDIPDVFTPFLKKLEQHTKLRDMYPSVKSGDLKLPERSTIPFSSSSLSTLSSGFDFLPTVDELINSSNGAIPSNMSTTSDKVNTITSSATITSSTAAALQVAGQATATANNQEQPSSVPRGVLDFIGGEDTAIQRLQNWIWRDDNLKNYFDIRNGMLGEQYSSKFSPWLALGCISPRYIAAEVKKYESERVSNKSTYWLIWELTCRDFFRYTCLKYGHRVFLSGGAKGIEKRWSVDIEKLTRWKEGMTGVPIVDANMRELKTTGFMSNRGRQIVASYLIFELNLDWRLGADHFESYLIDHDVYANYGNWNAMAGLTGGRINRFNMAKQSRDYDERGRYIHYWCPELRNIPAPSVFEPWLLSKQNQERCKMRIENPTTNIIASTTSATASTTTAITSDEYTTYPLPIAVQAFEPRNDYNSGGNNNSRGGSSSNSRNNDRHHSSNRTYNSSNHKNSNSNSRPSR